MLKRKQYHLEFEANAVAEIEAERAGLLKV